MCGKFVISLDFELIWGMLDQPNLESYKKNILGGRNAIPQILQLFDKYNIHATWATVGMLASSNKTELLTFFPQKKPVFRNELSSGYSYINSLEEDEMSDPCCFGESLIKKILEHDNQEIGSHTFSHYYCNETGADLESFKEDLIASKKIMKEKYNIDVTSIVFPRNHVRNNFLEIAKECGFICYRSNPSLYTVSKNRLKIFFSRLFRILDTYIPMFGENCFCETEYMGMISTCASRFLRPYSNTLKLLEPLKIKRIKRQMKYAAVNNKTFHLWWHPHNFGMNTEKMLMQLEELLIYYAELHKVYQFQSCNMGELELNHEK